MVRPILPTLVLAWLLCGTAGLYAQNRGLNMEVLPRWDNVPLYADQPDRHPPDAEASHLVNPGKQVLLESVLNEFDWPVMVEQVNGQWLRIRDNGQCNEMGRPLEGWVSMDAMVTLQDAAEHYTRQIELSQPEWAYWLRGTVFEEKAQWQLAINDYTAAIDLRRSRLGPAGAAELRGYADLDQAFSRRGYCQIQSLEIRHHNEADCLDPIATLARLPALYNHSMAASLRCRPITLERWALGYVIHIKPAAPKAGCEATEQTGSEPEKKSVGKPAGSEVEPRLAPPTSQAEALPAPLRSAEAGGNKPKAKADDKAKADFFDMRIYVLSLGGLSKTRITADLLDAARRSEIPMSIYGPAELEQTAANVESLQCVDPGQLCRRALQLKPDYAESHLTLALLCQWPSRVDQPLDTARFEAALRETDLAISVRQDYADALRWRAMLLLRQSYGMSDKEAQPLIHLARLSATSSCQALGFTGSSSLEVLAAVLARADDYSQAVRRQRLAAKLRDDDVANDWLAYYCVRRASAINQKRSCCPPRNP